MISFKNVSYKIKDKLILFLNFFYNTIILQEDKGVFNGKNISFHARRFFKVYR